MPSNDAADWLVSHYLPYDPNYGEVYRIIPHISWKKEDQIRLAKHYLRKIPFASALPYEAFASVMPIKKLLNVIYEYLPTDRNDLELLLYYLIPTLEKFSKTESDYDVMNSFIKGVPTLYSERPQI